MSGRVRRRSYRHSTDNNLSKFFRRGYLDVPSLVMRTRYPTAVVAFSVHAAACEPRWTFKDRLPGGAKGRAVCWRNLQNRWRTWPRRRNKAVRTRRKTRSNSVRCRIWPRSCPSWLSVLDARTFLLTVITQMVLQRVQESFLRTIQQGHPTSQHLSNSTGGHR